MARKGVESLSAKQVQCLELVGEGYTSAEIEGMLGISANTVNTHISLAVQKLEAPNRLHAARMLREHRIAINDPPISHHQNVTSQIQRLVARSPSGSDRGLEEAAANEDAEVIVFSPPRPLPAATEGSLHNDLIPTLKIVAFIFAIAAGFVVVLANYPSIIDGAKAIYNALPPTSITTR